MQTGFIIVHNPKLSITYSISKNISIVGQKNSEIYQESVKNILCTTANSPLLGQLIAETAPRWSQEWAGTTDWPVGKTLLEHNPDDFSIIHQYPLPEVINHSMGLTIAEADNGELFFLVGYAFRQPDHTPWDVIQILQIAAP
jgi:hypothetical protein